MEKLEFRKSVVRWIEASSKNSNQVLIGLGLEHGHIVQCQVVLESACCGSVLPAAEQGMALDSHDVFFIGNHKFTFL